jgi:hypothetical protein
VLVVHEFAQSVHFFVEGLKDGMGGEELVQPCALLLRPILRLINIGEIMAFLPHVPNL